MYQGCILPIQNVVLNRLSLEKAQMFRTKLGGFLKPFVCTIFETTVETEVYS